jgi:beta-lactamase regulating signal transducer with metallopeptidase domain
MTPNLIPWLLAAGKFILASSALLVFYRAFFRKNANYSESRVFLLSVSFIALLVSQFRIPVTQAETKIVWVKSVAEQESKSLDTKAKALTNEAFAVFGQGTQTSAFKDDQKTKPTEQASSLSTALKGFLSYIAKHPGSIFLTVYLVGMLFLAISLLVQYLSIRKLRRTGLSVFRDHFRLVTHAKVSCPFSFGKTIFLPQNLNETQLGVIRKHESWHIRHKHYVDVLIQELCTCIFWFNPIQWLIRKDLRSIHEFQTDRSVLDEGCDLYQYQTIILEEVMGNHFRLANGFNQSFTKKRFIQMKNQEPSKLSAFRKLMLVPFLTLLFAVLCFVPGQSQTVKVQKKVSYVKPDGKTETTLVDTLKFAYNKNMSEDETKDFLDSISRSANKIIPILKKLETADAGQKSLLFDEYLKAMNIQINGKTITSNDVPDLLSKLSSEDFKEMQNYLQKAQQTARKIHSQPQGESALEQQTTRDFVEQFANLGIMIKIMPEILNLMGSKMNEMMQGLAASTVSASKINVSDINTSRTLNNQKEPEPVPVYVNPYCKLSDELFEWSNEPFGSIRLVSIERKSKETVVILAIPIYENRWIRFSNRSRIVNRKNGDCYLLRGVENMPMNTEIFFHDVDRRMLLAKLFFPPLKQNVEFIDFGDDPTEKYENGDSWTLKNVRVSDYKPGSNKNSNIYR